MKVVGLVSSYREGRLIRGAIGSLISAALDRVFVFEGSAGMIVSAEAPESDLPSFDVPNLEVHHGAWPTDAFKRTAMIKHVQQTFPKEIVWGVWVDGDEVLRNGEFVYDLVQSLVWRDEQTPDEPPTAGMPIRLVEMDGTVVVCGAKVIRVDLIANYVVSSSGIKFKNGVTMAQGNLPDRLAAWWVPDRIATVERGERMLDAPLPCEPFLWHRSPLRHPARAGVRMHEQEAQELDRLGVLKITP